MKRLIFTCLLFTVFLLTSWAEKDSGTCGDNLTWTLDDDYKLTISGIGAMTDYQYGSSGSAPWYNYKDNIKSLIICEGVTSVGNLAFHYHTSLSSVIIPSSLISIGDNSFEGCNSLTSITIPCSVTKIGSVAFADCVGLTSITIPNSVTTIGVWAFKDCCNLTSVTIPCSVTEIGQAAFDGCSGIESMLVETGNKVYDSRNDCNAIIETSINRLIAGCKKTVIPNTVTSIAEGAFSGCSNLTSITIPNSVTTIYSPSFDGCNGLESIMVASDNPKYDSRDNCNAIIETSTNELVAGCKNTVIPNSVTSLGYAAFKDFTCMTTMTIPNSVTSIGFKAFDGCTNLTSITIPSSVTNIGVMAFNQCTSLSSITIPSSVTRICDATFQNCESLTSVTIPNTVKKIDDFAFSSCRKLISVTLPSSLTSIGEYAFSGCNRLTSITIPSSVTSIGGSAFSGCFGLNEIRSNIITPPSIETDVFVDYFSKLIVPSGCIDTYKNTAGWNDFTNIVSTLSTLEYAVYTNDTTVVHGKQITIPVYMKNVNAIAAWQADLVLPEGFTIAADSYGDPMICLAGDRTTTSRHSIATSTVNGVTHILCSSSSNKTFTGTDGEVAFITLNVADCTEAADYPIILRNQVIVEPDETGHEVSEFVSKITVRDYTPGDVNNDGKINAQDLVAIVNYILENPTAGNIREAADLNNDNKVDARDYVAGVNLILSQGSSSAKAMNTHSVECTGDLSIAPFSIASGEERTVDIKLDNANTDYSCAQLDIMLPEGLTLVDAESLSKNHSLAYRELENGSIRMLLSSAANKALHTQNGIISLTVKADGNMAGGLYEINANNELLVAPDGSYAAPVAGIFYFTVNGTTGVSSADANVNADSAAHYNISGQRVKAGAKGIVIVNGKKAFVR